MTRAERVAASIIDMVSEVIEEQHPEIEIEQGISVLHGVEYHALEKKIAETLLTYKLVEFPNEID